MPYMNPRGRPESPVWIVLDRPFSSDIPRGEIASGGMGYALNKILQEGGISDREVYVLALYPDTDSPHAASSVENFISMYKPPFIALVGEVAKQFLPDLIPRGEQSYKTQLNKYVGSLLRSPNFAHEHWCMPLPDIESLMGDWAERNVVSYVDINKLSEELRYWRREAKIQPYTQRTLLSHEMDTSEVLSYLSSFQKEPILAEDIETIYPRKNSEYYGEHPGVIVTYGIATSPIFGISFSLFRPTTEGTIEVLRALDKLHIPERTIIGQNFYNFDSYFTYAHGIAIPLESISDTLVRHHVLWPELPHSLQFLTRQYTRQPYYKDEGKSWNIKQLQQLRHYNCLDCTVDFEVWLGQEQEFMQRPHLR